MPIIPIQFVDTEQFNPNGQSSQKKGSGGNSFYGLMNQQQDTQGQGQNAFMNNDMTGGQMFMQWLGKLLSPSFIGAM